MSKKVCFVSIFAYPLFNPECDLTFGGAEVQISLISRELARDDDFDVSVVVADTGQDMIEVHDNVSIYKSYKRGRNLLNLLKAPFQLYGTLKKINPDVVVCRAAGIEVGITGIYAKMNRKKFVYSMANDEDVGENEKGGLRQKIYSYGISKVDYFIAQNNFQAERLEGRKYRIIKNSFPAKTENIENRKNILWVGREGSVKRPEIFIKLVESLPNEQFVMIMPKSENAQWDSIVNKAKKLANLEFIESVPFSEIDKYYRQAKIFVNTSFIEGFPNTFIQSAMNGTPIVSLKVNPDSFLEEYKCGIACGDDFEKMKNGIEKILFNKEYYETLSSNSRKYFKENHDIEKNIIKWGKILKK